VHVCWRRDAYRGGMTSAAQGPTTTLHLDEAAVAHHLPHLTWNADGLIPAIVQDGADGTVLMMAWVNRESLAMTLQEGRTVFWSRSRQELWRKGDTSGDRQFVRQALYDCDGDTLLFVVDQEGKGACHTGSRTCFFRSFADSVSSEPGKSDPA
jgi:phosphoribosyl-AMP cyclohydrolase